MQRTRGAGTEVRIIEKRVWIRSGIVEDLDARQSRLIQLVYEKVVLYYQHLYRTRPCYQHPLSLSRLMKLCNRSGQAVSLALRYLANTIPYGSDEVPRVYYYRDSSERNHSHRPYKIFLRKQV